MDILNLDANLKYVATCGESLNIDEKVQLRLALLKLQESEEFDEVLFWGRIRGEVRDYYIAIGIVYKGFYEFPLKKFYWTTSATFVFEQLPHPNEQNKKDVDERETIFFGEPEKPLIEVKTEEGGEPAGGEDPGALEEKVEEKKEDLEASVDVKPQVIPKNFTELDRLAYVVAAIENETHVVPEGAFKLLPIHEIRRNNAFKGLAKEDLPKLEKYYHFRNVQSLDKKVLLETNESIFHEDIFDPVKEDLPRGAWSVQIDSSKTVATVRSLLWPGYVAFSVANSNIFGGVYFGDGLKNKDLAFML